MEALVEVLNLVVPLALALGDVVKLVLHLGGEVVVENLWEVLGQEFVNHHTHIGGDEFALLVAHEFALALGADFAVLERDLLKAALHTLALALHHVVTRLNGRDGGCIGRRTSNAQFLESFHEHCLAIAVGLLSKALSGNHFPQLELVAHLHYWQHVELSRSIDGIVVVAGLEIDLEEAVKLHYLTVGDEALGASADVDVHLGLLELGVGHLRSDSAFPNQVIEFPLLGRAANVVVLDKGGTDGLVSLLGTLRRGVVLAHLEVLVAQSLLNLLADGVNGKAAQVDRVGTHVGDVTALI